MIFNKFMCYQSEHISLSPEELHEKMLEHEFKPCDKNEFSSFGWTQPLGRYGELLTHAANGCILIAAKLEEKVIPTSVVKEMADEKIADMEEVQDRSLTKDEKDEIKEQIRLSLLPKAFTKSKTTFAYIDTMKNWIVVNTTSSNEAEDLLALLRGSLESLDVVPAATEDAVSAGMSYWLKEKKAAEGFEFTNECEIKEVDGRGTIKVKNQNVTDAEVLAHIDIDTRVTELGLNWDERVAFVLNEDLKFKSVKMVGMNKDSLAEAKSDNFIEMFDASFALMTLEFREFMPAVFNAFGGLITHEKE